ncbi:MAG: flagellar biosynthetic protein FliO [bacterium]|jgi:flagellar protein FliO/FliZ|nr:flagellar biosynthetic protein FliO [Betaproteobacteria bacterium]
MSLARALLCMALGPAVGIVHAADALPPSPVTFAGLLQVLLGLALVLAAIVATGWLLRRIGPSQSAGGLLRVVGGVMVGPRERLVVVEVGEQWLILGVAAGSVNLLQTVPRGTAGVGSSAAGQSFDPAWLKRLLAGGRPPR